MRILVTGSSGFIGRHLVKELKKQHYIVITNDIKGHPDIKGNFTDVTVDCDVVIHLAAVVGVDTTRLDPERVLKVNFLDTKRFIDRYSDKRFIFSSSSEVYGNSLNLPFSEANPPTPISLYGSLKVVIENYLKERGVNTGIVRFFNVYGKGQRDEFVISEFIGRAIKKEPLEVYGTGKQVRCFTYIDDAVEGLIKVMNYKSKYDIFNIGNHRKSTINNVVSAIKKVIPCRVRHLEYGSKGVRNKYLEIQKRIPNMKKAWKLLRFSSKVTLEEGIKKIICDI